MNNLKSILFGVLVTFLCSCNDPVENAALQILNILFAVPQLSVILDSLSNEQLEMANYYLSYWNENRSILLDGNFRADDPGALYPILRANGEDKEIIAVYNEALVHIDQPFLVIDIINAKPGNSIVIELSKSIGKCNITVYDCMGKMSDSYQMNLSRTCDFSVPASGMVKIEKQ